MAHLNILILGHMTLIEQNVHKTVRRSPERLVFSTFNLRLEEKKN